MTTLLLGVLMESDLTYILSSFKKNPEFFFQGYCFDKENFIFGQEGADKYYEATGRKVALGEDGCYVCAKKTKDGYEIGSDYSGFKKILYFKDEKSGNWAVSNSLILLIKHLAEYSIKVTPNIQSIMMMHVGITVFQQPVTFNTIANEIKILPINSILSIGRNSLEIKKVDDATFLETDYHKIMINFVKIWSSRIATLLSYKDFFVQQGLTGGLDSRSVFSLSHIARQGEEVNSDYRLISNLTGGDDIDIKVAQKIANHYNYKLNDKSPSLSYEPKNLSTQARYSIWKDTSLGLYHPIYFPGFEIDYRKISIGGHGGENYRIFYAKNPKIYDYDSFIESLSKSLKDPKLKIELANELRETLSKIREADTYGNEMDPLILHYKHFRNRFHSGLFPQYRVTFNPLSSRYLANIVSKKNFQKIESSQILYDLISLTDQLIDIPYDDSKKYPSKKNINELIKINVNLSPILGVVYAGVPHKNKDNSLQTKRHPIEYLREDFDKACQSQLVKNIWSASFIKKAANNLSEAEKFKKFKNAKDSISVSTIIATGIFEVS